MCNYTGVCVTIGDAECVVMGILPEKDSGFGDVEKAASVFARNEIQPLQARMLELNDWLGEEVIRFKPYKLVEGGASAPAVPPRL